MDDEWERICEIIRLDVNTADRLFKCFDPRKTVAAIDILTGGKRTTNYNITLKESDQQFVLRVYPKDDRSWLKELAVQKLFQNSVPVPEIFYVNEDRRIIDKAFSIVQFLDGITLDKYLAGNNDISEPLAQKIGEILAVIHQKEFINAGALDENLSVVDSLPPILSWWDYFLNGRAGERLDPDVRNRLLKFIKENLSILEQMTRHFVFSHGDFRPANIMVKDGELIGIIDWEGALSAPAYFDIGQFIRYREQVPEKAKKSFINAYNRNTRRPVGEDWEKLARTMDLVNIFCFLDNEQERPHLFADMRVLAARTLEILEPGG